MRRDEFVATVKAMCGRDNSFPNDEKAVVGLMRYALEIVAIKADSKQLLISEDVNNREVLRVIRDSYGDTIGLIARPILPLNDEDTFDIEEGLIFAVIEYFVSFLSIEKYRHHETRANGIITKFNESGDI